MKIYKFDDKVCINIDIYYYKKLEIFTNSLPYFLSSFFRKASISHILLLYRVSSFSRNTTTLQSHSCRLHNRTPFYLRNCITPSKLHRLIYLAFYLKLAALLCCILRLSCTTNKWVLCSPFCVHWTHHGERQFHQYAL